MSIKFKHEMTREIWTVGDIYFQANGLMNGSDWDIGSEPQVYESEANAEGEDWLSWLSENEKKTARFFVNKYEVLSVDENGKITSAISV